MTEFYCKDAAATEKLGVTIGKLLQSGDVVCLSGTLGAGKTLFAKGVATALGIVGSEVSSPTFAIMNIYNGTLELRHFDLYRINRQEELVDIGFDEYVGNSGVTLIEWGELFLEQLPLERLDIIITIEADGRLIKLQPIGEHYKTLCKEVEQVVDFSD